jgi:hypothetical protein
MCTEKADARKFSQALAAMKPIISLSPLFAKAGALSNCVQWCAALSIILPDRSGLLHISFSSRPIPQAFAATTSLRIPGLFQENV